MSAFEGKAAMLFSVNSQRCSSCVHCFHCRRRAARPEASPLSLSSLFSQLINRFPPHSLPFVSLTHYYHSSAVVYLSFFSLTLGVAEIAAGRPRVVRGSDENVFTAEGNFKIASNTEHFETHAGCTPTGPSWLIHWLVTRCKSFAISSANVRIRE